MDNNQKFFDDRIIKEQNDVYQIAKICIEVFQMTGHKLVWVDRIKAKANIIKISAQNEQDNISVKECQRIHRNLKRSPQMEILNASQYKIEVSSPGGKRPLVRKNDFQKFQNHKVFIKTFQNNNKIIGKLVENDEDKISILTEEQQELIHIKYTDIKKAHTVIDKQIYQEILKNYKASKQKK